MVIFIIRFDYSLQLILHFLAVSFEPIVRFLDVGLAFVVVELNRINTQQLPKVDYLAFGFLSRFLGLI